MNLRRRPKIERVVEIQGDLEPQVRSLLAEAVVALRRAMVEAIVLIQSGHPDAAAKRLNAALEAEQ